MPNVPQLFATVALDQPVDHTYTYFVPLNLRKEAQPGARVTVPLGRANRQTMATILSLSDQPPPMAVKDQEPTPAEENSLFENPGEEPETHDSGLKQISSVLTHVLPVPADLLKLAQWISSYYCTPSA